LVGSTPLGRRVDRYSLGCWVGCAHLGRQAGWARQGRQAYVGR